MTTIFNPLNQSLINVGYHYAKKGAPEHLEYSQNIAHGPDGTYIIKTQIPANVEHRNYEIFTDYTDYCIVYSCLYVDGKYQKSICVRVLLINLSVTNYVLLFYIILAQIWVNGRTVKFSQRNFNLAVKRLASIGIHIPPQDWSMSYTATDC